MPVIVYQVGSGNDDTNSQSNLSDTGGTGNVIAGDLSASLLRPGNHAANDRWYMGARFTNISASQGETINSACFVVTGASTYAPSSGSIKLLVRMQLSTDASTFGTAPPATLAVSDRPRTSASTIWDVFSVVSGTEYSVDVTAQMQEVVNQGGWAASNAAAVLVELSAVTTGEWQDFLAYNSIPASAPKLRVDTGGGGGGVVSIPMALIAGQIPFGQGWAAWPRIG